jgi:FMN reductase
MSEPLKVLLVSGSSGQQSSTCTVLESLGSRLEALGAGVDFLDLARDPLPLFDIDSVYSSDYYKALSRRADSADCFVLGTPDYHGTMSSILKNFLDHLWKEMAGKLIGSVVASYDRGLTVTDHIRTVARQYYAWSLPYAVAFQEKKDVTIQDGIISPEFEHRLEMVAHDVIRYGCALRDLRKEGLTEDQPGFMAHYRPKK